MKKESDVVQELVQARRIESPSSINTYNQCPRKYYFTYIAKLPSKGNIYQVKGNVVHSVLESFFDQKLPEDINYENAEERFKQTIFNLFSRFWKEKHLEIKKIELSEAEQAIGIDDCINMLYSWAEIFVKRMRKTGLVFSEAFKSLTPLHKEKYFVADEYAVHGFVDVIEEKDGKIRLMDYKTSGSSYLTDEYLLQLGIYALLYKTSFNSVPHEVGIYFLKDENGEKVLSVTEYLLENAKRQIKEHHFKALSDNIEDYPKKISNLCKWSNGKCDFYEVCFDKDGSERPTPKHILPVNKSPVSKLPVTAPKENKSSN